jgi:hypothetical protein
MHPLSDRGNYCTVYRRKPTNSFEQGPSYEPNSSSEILVSIVSPPHRNRYVRPSTGEVQPHTKHYPATSRVSGTRGMAV